MHKGKDFSPTFEVSEYTRLRMTLKSPYSIKLHIDC